MTAVNVFLRQRDGTALGPLTKNAVEVLWDAHVIDENTPVSEDGETFLPVEAHEALHAHLQTVKSELDHGRDPWPEQVEVRAPRAPEAVEAKSMTALLLLHAQKRAHGVLRCRGAHGSIHLHLRDGKVVTVDGTGQHTLDHWLLSEALVTPPQLEAARTQAPTMGGDLGAALVAGGALAPDLYFEKLVGWATALVSQTLFWPMDQVSFEPCEVPPPNVPLGLDRFALPFIALREGVSRSTLEEKLLPQRTCPLIPSQLDGLTIEETKPKPRELRALNAINGAKTLGDLLDELGGSDERSRDVLRAVLFATEAGFVVMGADPLLEKERGTAAKLRQELEAYRKKSFFERLTVTEKTSDEDVRQRYADLVKIHHPDTLRPGVAEALRTVREEFFQAVTEAFEALETSDQRYNYALDLDAGRVGQGDEQERVRALLEAETSFKKAEILLRMKKYDEALEMVGAAIELVPDEHEFKIFEAYANYLNETRRGENSGDATKAIKAILGVLKIDANIARGYLYLGYLHKSVSKNELAVKYFKKVLEYDEAHPEAVREVRLANARKEKEKKRRWGL